MGAGVIWEISIISTQFCCEPKNDLVKKRKLPLGFPFTLRSINNNPYLQIRPTLDSAAKSFYSSGSNFLVSKLKLTFYLSPYAQSPGVLMDFPLPISWLSTIHAN